MIHIFGTRYSVAPSGMFVATVPTLTSLMKNSTEVAAAFTTAFSFTQVSAATGTAVAVSVVPDPSLQTIFQFVDDRRSYLKPTPRPPGSRNRENPMKSEYS